MIGLLFVVTLFQFHPIQSSDSFSNLFEKHYSITNTKIITQPIKMQNNAQITIHNTITKEMLGYSYCGTHYPDTFQIFVNDIEIKQAEKQVILVKDQKISIDYVYRFGPYYQGAKRITFNLEPNQTDFFLAFNWHDKYRILINNAHPDLVQVIAKK